MPCFTGAEVAAAHERIAMQNRLGLDSRLGRPGRGRRAQPGDGAGPDAGRVVLRAATAGSTRRATCWPTPPRCSPPASRSASAAAFTGLTTDGGRVTGVRTTPRRHLLRAGAADRRPDPRRRRGRRGCPDLVGRDPAPGRGHPAAPRARARPGADGLRRGLGHLLAPEEGGLLWGMSQPRRGARRGAAVRRGLLRADAGPGGRSGPGRPPGSGCAGPGRPPSTTPPTTCRSSARCSPPTGTVDGRLGRRRRRSRDDVGPRGVAGGGRPRSRGTSDVVDAAHPRAWTASTTHGRSSLAADPIALPFPEVTR